MLNLHSTNFVAGSFFFPLYFFFPLLADTNDFQSTSSCVFLGRPRSPVLQVRVLSAHNVAYFLLAHTASFLNKTFWSQERVHALILSCHTDGHNTYYYSNTSVFELVGKREGMSNNSHSSKEEK